MKKPMWRSLLLLESEKLEAYNRYMDDFGAKNGDIGL